MSPISSKSSNGFPFHFKKNPRTLWSFTRLPMILTLSLSLDHSDPVSLSYLQFLKQTSLRLDLCKCFPFCWKVFSSPHGKTLRLTRLWSKVIRPIRPCLALLYELEPLPPSSFSTPLNAFFLSILFIISCMFFVLIFTACPYDSDVNFMRAENISFIATSLVLGICSHIADTQ